MTAPHGVRRIGAILALVVALAFPMSALAVTTTGDTTEGGINITATIAMVVPGTATYALNAGTWSYTNNISGLTTDNPSGLKVSAKVDPFTAGATVIPTTARSTSMAVATGGLIKGTNVAAGGWADNTTSKILSTSTAPVTDAMQPVTHSVAATFFTLPGNYTSAVHYTAATNP